MSAATLLRIWLTVGIQSFGGGVATLALVQQAAVDRYGWLTEEEFTRTWAICQMAPGINLLALTILLGRKVAGAKGIAAGLIGLLLPSFVVTLLATALYERIRTSPHIEAALRGVIPATVGVGLFASWRIARPLLAASRKEGRPSLAFSILLLLASGALAMRRFSVTGVLLLLASIGGAYRWGAEAARKRKEER
jgi:chromate transporter